MRGFGFELLRVLQRDVPGRNIDVIDRREDQLQRAALGPHHQIDAARVTLQPLLQLT
jgi:hypothetical protein